MPKSASKGVSCHMLPPTSCQLSIIIHYVLTWGMFLPAGENCASVVTVFENTHILSVACTSYVTSLGWGVGDVNVYVNLRHMHILRYVTGLGGGGC